MAIWRVAHSMLHDQDYQLTLRLCNTHCFFQRQQWLRERASILRHNARCFSCHRTVSSHHKHSLRFASISLDIVTLLYRAVHTANCAMAKRHFMVTQMVFPSSHGLLAKLSKTRCYFEVATKFLDVRGDACVTL